MYTRVAAGDYIECWRLLYLSVQNIMKYSLAAKNASFRNNHVMDATHLILDNSVYANELMTYAFTRVWFIQCIPFLLLGTKNLEIIN